MPLPAWRATTRYRARFSSVAAAGRTRGRSPTASSAAAPGLRAVPRPRARSRASAGCSAPRSAHLVDVAVAARRGAMESEQHGGTGLVVGHEVHHQQSGGVLAGEAGPGLPPPAPRTEL